MPSKDKKSARKRRKSAAKPFSIIVIAVVLAAGAALYFSRQPSQVASTSPSASTASSNAAAPAPVGPRIDMPIGGGHFLGSSGAPITLVEFGDYQCPTCAAFAPVVNDLLRQHADQVRLEFHYYPLRSIHRNAIAAATAAESASEQNRFWEMHDLLFQRQTAWANLPDAKPEFLSYARELGLDVEKFSRSMASPEVQQRVLDDENKAQRANLNEVPSFFVNGSKILLPAQNAELFFRLIQQSAPRGNTN